MKQGIALNPNYFEGYCRLSQILFIINKDKKYDGEIGNALNNCLDRGGAEQLSSPNMLKLGINYYVEAKDFNRAALLAERLAVISDADPEVWYNLAKIYFVLGNNPKAEESFQKALILKPTLMSDWEAFKKATSESLKVKK
jgi:tetratricopeptide (TPR) repeat protein